MWQQEGEGPRQLAGGKACTAAPASTEPEQGAPARGWALDAGTEHAPRVPALLPQPSPSPACPPHVCTHRLPRLYWGQRQPVGCFIAAPIVTRPLCCHRPQSASQASPTRHPQPGNSSWPWAPRASTDTMCRPISREPGNPRASLYKAGTSALPHNPCQIKIWVTGPRYALYIGVGFY